MKHENELLAIKEQLPYLALISIASYACSIAFQLGYFAAFKVDLFIISPRIDPTSLFTLAIVIGVIAMGAAEISLLNWFATRKSFSAALVVDIFLLGIFGGPYITYLLNMNEINNNIAERGGPPGYFVHVLPLLIVIMYAIRVIKLFQMIKSKNVKFTDAFAATSPFLLLETKKAQSKKSGRYTRWIFLSLIVVLLFVVLPATAGNSYAKSKSNFTEIVPEKKSKNNLKTIIVGAAANGYVVKIYDTNKKKFTSSWQIVNADNLELRPIKLTSIDDQK